MIRSILSLLLVTASVPAWADPVRHAMNTPASLLDVFLFRLNEEAKCNSWMPNERMEEPALCLTGLRFSAASGVLKLYFREYPHSENLGDFVTMNDLEREEFLLRYIDRVAQRAGVVNDWGMIHSVPVTTGANAELDITAFREALAKQTEVHLNVEFSGAIYAVSRLADGAVEFEMR